ncbi:major capsid protein [Blackfly microvirus SF02]|uniref:Major capsid protein n=1 Tax=Blackfly microvirus SF02 TaxID=2576452 RepID=A0A4P8PRY8_9VIRU|nr:major capsid protein [Blackfly microvirus SF02]
MVVVLIRFWALIAASIASTKTFFSMSIFKAMLQPSRRKIAPPLNTGKLKMRNGQTHLFSQVPKAEIPRSRFDRSHNIKTTFDSGYIVPIFVDEALPGDTFNLNLSIFGRLATPLHPFMDNMFVDHFFFSVPYRLVWDNWQKFNGEQVNPGDSTSYLIPQMVSPVGGYAEQTLSDYFGIPTKIAGLTHSALWHRAYNRIYNEWFRDENLQNSVTVPMGDGPDTPATYTLLRRGKRHDYFTSALPWPQKGPAVQLPLGSTAPVLRTNNAPKARVYIAGTNSAAAANIALGTNANGNDFGPPSNTSTYSLDPNGGLYTDLSAATAATINQIRQAFQIQRMYERDARGGTRYTEIIRSHFGVTSPDARLQRTEYLGGGTVSLNVNPIAQTSNTATQPTPQGNLAAMGTFSNSRTGFTQSFTEHCLILGFVSVRADLNYQQGLNRMWSRNTRFDFYWPALSHLGEQTILNKEIYAQGNSTDDLAFGYQERNAEYRYKPSIITGRMRSNSTLPLDTWHLAQNFSALPALNNTFIVENPPVPRVLAVLTEPQILYDGHFKLTCARPMPIYGVPGNIDRF